LQAPEYQPNWYARPEINPEGGKTEEEEEGAGAGEEAKEEG